MARVLAALALAMLASMLASASALSQVQPRTCGVLDGPGCNPHQCGVLDGPGCLSQAQAGGFGQNLQLTLGTRAARDAKKPSGRLDSLRDLFLLLRACLLPPAPENAQHGMQMTLRFSFNAAGELIAPPQVTYATPGVSQKTREAYRNAVARSLEGCTPLPFSQQFAGAIAGRPIAIRVVDDREGLGGERRADVGSKPRAN
jgi:hypothetical protein